MNEKVMNVYGMIKNSGSAKGFAAKGSVNVNSPIPTTRTIQAQGRVEDKESFEGLLKSIKW